MRKYALKFSFLALFNLIIFIGLFQAFQHSGIYKHTLGKISKNYERTGSWDNYSIDRVSKPYMKIAAENFERWDADIYNCIKEHMYSTEDGCYHKVRGAFFPLFPLLWKATNTGYTGISILNYFLFSLSIGLLVLYLGNSGPFDKTILFALLLSLPSTIIYYIPYSESLFLFTMALASVGLVKKKYGLYFTGSFLLAMVRPASLFIFIAILLVESLFYYNPVNFKNFIKELSRKTIPFLSGYLVVIIIQYAYSSSWTTFLDAGKFWEGGFLQGIKSISDWSEEGFALSSFSLFFISIPAFLFALFTIFKRKKIMLYLHSGKNVNIDSNTFLFLISVFYLAGIFIFTLLTSGGNMHSFFRFTLASPPFYIVAILIFNSFTDKSYSKSLIVTFISIFLLILFLHFTTFGGSRFGFSFWGMYLFIVNYLYFIFRGKLNKKSQVLLLVSLVLMNLIWNTYMLNIFFSNGWIFT
ncbi:MAG: hypothetical protein J7L04_01950 [Bacteroidales bacterium]|nr:hypothetical protein [Bacteroidales bacterium]